MLSRTAAGDGRTHPDKSGDACRLITRNPLIACPLAFTGTTPMTSVAPASARTFPGDDTATTATNTPAAAARDNLRIQTAFPIGFVRGSEIAPRCHRVTDIVTVALYCAGERKNRWP